MGHQHEDRQQISLRKIKTEARLHGRTLWLLRALWLLIVAFALYMLVLNIPAIISAPSTICHDPTYASCSYLQLRVEQLPALQHYGISLAAYTTYALVCDLLISLLFLGVGLLIFWRKSDEVMGLFVSLLLVTFAATGVSEVHMINTPPAPFDIIGLLLIMLQWPALGLLFYTFPDGRFVPRWSWLLTALFVINLGFYLLLPYPYNIDNWPPLLGLVWSLIVYGSAVGMLIYRYLVVASPLQRQQIKWLAFGFVVTVLLLMIKPALPLIFPALSQPDSWYQLTFPAELALDYLPIPLGIGIALLRYRLWDVDVIINRALVYGSLTGSLALVYAGLVFGMQYLFGRFSGLNAQSPVVIVLSTLVIALLFQPLRRALQSGIDRRFYRRKYDAARILAAFSAALHNEVELHQLSQQLVSVVEETMRPAHVSLWLCERQEKTQMEEHVN